MVHEGELPGAAPVRAEVERRDAEREGPGGAAGLHRRMSASVAFSGSLPLLLCHDLGGRSRSASMSWNPYSLTKMWQEPKVFFGSW